jgi:sugar/nucleoside kinase (ribokinase family)
MIACVGNFPSLQSAADTRSAAEKLLSLGANNLQVTMGGQGTILFDGKIESNISACTGQAVDPTAAGDCEVGALMVGLYEGKSLPGAAAFASVAAAISTTRAGAQLSVPRRDEVERFIHDWIIK